MTANTVNGEAPLAGMSLEEIQAHARYSAESTNAVVEALFKALVAERASSPDQGEGAPLTIPEANYARAQQRTLEENGFGSVSEAIAEILLLRHKLTSPLQARVELPKLLRDFPPPWYVTPDGIKTERSGIWVMTGRPDMLAQLCELANAFPASDKPVGSGEADWAFGEPK